MFPRTLVPDQRVVRAGAVDIATQERRARRAQLGGDGVAVGAEHRVHRQGRVKQRTERVVREAITVLAPSTTGVICLPIGPAPTETTPIGVLAGLLTGAGSYCPSRHRHHDKSCTIVMG